MKGNVMAMAGRAVEQTSTGPKPLPLLDKLRAWAMSDDFMEMGAYGLGAVEYPYCEFIGTYRESEAARQIQDLLRQRGAANLKVDGLWGPCTDSAFQNVFGEPLTQESLQRLLGVTCKSFNKQVTGSCTNGSDAIMSTPPIGPGPTTTTTVAPVLSLFKFRSALTRQSRPSIATRVSFIPKPADQGSPKPAPNLSTTSVGGIPDWALGLGLVAVVAGAAYMIKKKRS